MTRSAHRLLTSSISYSWCLLFSREKVDQCALEHRLGAATTEKVGFGVVPPRWGGILRRICGICIWADRSLGQVLELNKGLRTDNPLSQRLADAGTFLPRLNNRTSRLIEQQKESYFAFALPRCGPLRTYIQPFSFLKYRAPFLYLVAGVLSTYSVTTSSIPLIPQNFG